MPRMSSNPVESRSMPTLDIRVPWSVQVAGGGPRRVGAAAHRAVALRHLVSAPRHADLHGAAGENFAGWKIVHSPADADRLCNL